MLENVGALLKRNLWSLLPITTLHFH